MRPTTILALSTGLLMACGGAGAQRAGTGARDAGKSEARSGASGQPAADYAPFGPRAEQRRGQDSVLRTTGLRKRQRAAPDST